MAEIRQGDSVFGRPYTNDKNDNFTLLPREYWISPDALVILLNALDNPQYAQVSLLSGAVVMAYRYGVIDYSYNMNYRTWTLQAFNTLFDRTDRVHVYAQLDKDGKDALIIYSYDKLELQGIATDNTGQQKNVFNVYLGTISAAVDDQGADIPRTWEYPLVTGNLRTDLGINQGQTLWVDNFEIRTDDFGVEYLFAKKPLATIGGLVQYATPDIVVPSLFEGIPFDNKTIWLNPDTKVVEVIGGGGTGDLNLEKMWAALAGNTSEQINISHLTSALNGYATQEWVKNQNYVTAEGLAKDFVTIATEQEITGLKHFTAGLSVGTGKHKLYEKDGVVYFDGDFVVTGGITQYGMGDRKPSTIMDGVVVDGTTISKDGGVLKVIGGGASFDLAAMWSALAGNTNEQISINHLTTALAGYATTTALNNLSTEVSKKWTQDDAKIKNWDTAFGWGNHAEAGYAHLAGEETFTGLKHFTAGLSVGAGKHKLYEKDGVVYLDGDLAVTGGITQYALVDTPVSTIMDGVVTDNVTIKKENGKLVVIGGGGSSFDDAQMWKLLEASTTEQINHSHLTTALQGYATESWVNSNFPTKLGVGASGTWGIDINGTAANANKLGNTPLTNNKQWWGSVPFVATDGTFEIGKYIDFHNANGESNDYSTRLQCSGAHVNIVNLPSGNGTLALLSDNVSSATKLANTRTIWGQNFNGEHNVSGELFDVAGIRLSGGEKFDRNGNIVLPSSGKTHNWNVFNSLGNSAFKVYANGIADIYIAEIGEYLLYHNEATLKIYSDYNPSSPTEYGRETACIQTSFDGQDPTTSTYPSQIPSRCVLALQPRGGWVGIGLRNPTAMLDVNGNILSRGGITQYSDQRAKTIIEQITLSLQSIANSPAIRFKWNGWKQQDDGKTHIGGIAQYVQRILPEAIYDTDGALTMDYAITGYIFAVNTAKHLLSYETKTDKEIRKLKKRIVYLENKLKEYGSTRCNN